MTTVHGYEIIRFQQISEEFALVIAHRDAAWHRDPYVVWVMNKATGECDTGSYCLTLKEAQRVYERRWTVYRPSDDETATKRGVANVR